MGALAARLRAAELGRPRRVRDVEPWILLVERSRDDELIFLRSWRSTGVPGRVLVARTETEALDRVRRPPDGMGPPSLVLLDVDPRGGHGFGLLVRLHALDPDNRIPLVAFSNSTDEEVVDEAYRLGVVSYVRKPIDPADFVQTLRVLGQHWLRMRIAPPTVVVRPVPPPSG